MFNTIHRALARTALAAVACGAFSSTAAPTDNLRADYRNTVPAAPYTNRFGTVAATLGPGAGQTLALSHQYVWQGSTLAVGYNNIDAVLRLSARI